MAGGFRLSTDLQLSRLADSTRPKPARDEDWKQPFAAQTEKLEAAVSNLKFIFLLIERRLCSDSGQSEFMANEYRPNDVMIWPVLFGAAPLCIAVVRPLTLKLCIRSAMAANFALTDVNSTDLSLPMGFHSRA